MAVNTPTEDRPWGPEDYRKHKQTYQLMGGAVLVLFLVWLGSQGFREDTGHSSNLFTELLGLIATVVVLDVRAERRAIKSRKDELTLQLGSPANDFALEAKRQLEQLGWLEEALLEKSFKRASWREIHMESANLTRADLRHADLTGADLRHADLTEANLVGTILTGADLRSADLTRADLGLCYPDGGSPAARGPDGGSPAAR